ncbi:MAG: CBS domain-containing protein [Cyclobacteriaceae bacterium]
MDADQLILRSFIEKHPREALQVIENLSGTEIAALIESLETETATNLMGQMDRFNASKAIGQMNRANAVDLLAVMPGNKALVILRQLEKGIRDEILNSMPRPLSVTLKKLIDYNKNQIGAYANPSAFTLFEDETIEDACKKIKEFSGSVMSQIYVLTRDNSLAGFIEMKALLSYSPNKLLGQVINQNLPKMLADMDVAVFAKGSWQEPFESLAIVDADNLFLGIITRETVSDMGENKKPYDRHAHIASGALGDLYQIGISSLLKNTAEVKWNPGPKRTNHGNN